MPGDLENAIATAANKVAQYIADVATLQVVTRYIDLGEGGSAVNTIDRTGFDSYKLVAYTEINLDAGTKAVVPIHKTSTGDLELDCALLEVHQQSVANSIEYRSRMLNALLSLLHAQPK